MSRTATLAGYALMATALIAAQVVALVSRRVPTLGEAVTYVTGRRAGRWIVCAAWLWVGWHLFVRSHV